MAWRMKCTITTRCPFRHLPTRTISLRRKCRLCPVSHPEVMQTDTARSGKAAKRLLDHPTRRRQGIPSWKRGRAKTLSPIPVWRTVGDMRKSSPGEYGCLGKADFQPGLLLCNNQCARACVASETRYGKWTTSVHIPGRKRHALTLFTLQQDRRPITPPPCIRLIITDVTTGKEVDCK